MKTSTVLKRALRLLDGGRRWIKGDLRGKKPGVRGLCYCSEGAIYFGGRLDAFISSEAFYALKKAIGSKYRSVYLWNDSPSRRWSHVEAAFKRAIQLAEKEDRR